MGRVKMADFRTVCFFGLTGRNRLAQMGQEEFPGASQIDGSSGRREW